MAIYNFQYRTRIDRPDGTTLNITRRDALLIGGPCLQVTIGLSVEAEQRLLQRGGTVPTPVSGTALIDRGATASCIDDETARRLRFPVIDRVDMATPSHPSTIQSVYPIHVAVAGSTITFDIDRAAGAHLSDRGLLLLIGRDALRDCILIYNGETGSVSLAR